jgi:hypothetical protein
VSNIGPSRKVRESVTETYAALDRLPEPVRRVIQFVPYDFSVVDVLGAWARLGGVVFTDRQFAEQLARAYSRRRCEEAARLYGPTHPQASA